MTENDAALRLLADGHPADAVPILKRLAWIDPSYKAYTNLAVALRLMGELDDGLQYCCKALALDPTGFNAWLAAANIYTDLGEWHEAMIGYEAAFNRVTNDPGAMATGAIQQVAIGYAQALLRDRRMIEGWPLWELGRFNRSYGALPGTQRWLGEPCKSLLVVCEGGFGDAMLFARWLPLCKTRAKKVKLVIWDSMITFRDWSLLGVDEVFPKSAPVSNEGLDYTTSWMSLPGIFGLRNMAEMPKDEEFREQRHGDVPRIGFCWRAEEAGSMRKIRSLPCAQAEVIANRLWRHGQVISLIPYKKHLYRADDEPWPINVTQDETLICNWQVTTSTIKTCKLVVTVDTAVAHLAGLCGVPTLLLIPRSSEWKWGTHENTPDDPWYGPHVTYFRNSDPYKWDVELIRLAADALAEGLRV